MAVGDVNSNARGSGARYNDNKPTVELYPIRLLAVWAAGRNHDASSDAARAVRVLYRLADMQERVSTPRVAATNAVHELSAEDVLAGARVFDYGRRKYALWNWAKGMPWSVPLACAARHALAVVKGDILDSESGESHMGHVACNLTMLWTYAETYPEGDDLPAPGTLAMPAPPAPVDASLSTILRPART